MGTRILTALCLTAALAGQAAVSSPDATRTYAAKAAAAKPGDADAQYRLAEFCKAHGLEKRMRRHARRALRIDPDHPATRALLGHQQVKGKWLSEDEAKQALGFVRYLGRWRLPQEIEYLKRAREKRVAEQVAVVPETRDQRIERLLRALDSQVWSVRENARRALLEIAARDDRPDLDRRARTAFSMTRPVPTSAGTGIFTLNLQKTELLGFDTFPINFGMGGTARVQLPRVRSIGFGGTVALPLGIRN